MSELVDLGGVFAFMRDDGLPGATNSAVIVDNDGLTIVDAQLTPADAEELASAAAGVGDPVRRLVLTSSHMPFVGGSGVFVLPAVYGSPQISAHLDQEPHLPSCQALYPNRSAELLEVVDRPCRRVTHTVSEAAFISERVVTAPVGGEIDENLIAQVPDAQVVFGGALCSFGITPMAGMGDPAAWADSLDQLLGWGEIFVPGQGPIGGSEEVLRLQAYLRACVDAEGDVSRLGDGPWTSWSARHYDEINVERAAAIAAGDHEPQPKLRQLFGV